MSTVRTGEYINIFNGKYDVYIILNESNDPITPEQVEKATEIMERYFSFDGEMGDLDERVYETILEFVFRWGVEVIIRRR